MKDLKQAEFLNDPSGSNQRKTILGTIYQNDVRLLEEALLAIEQTDDVELLKLFAILSPFLFVEQFRMIAPLMFGEAFTRVRPALWHLLNNPTWWKTLRKHLNDGLPDAKSKI